eukprot:CAMPEP_0181336638 /NCGR_PEP_ID=MMETSP1101-20121128/27537_1 /TAXON_ID=46948 /ORGANISM="Rhodomonas abbreviata, Strain Caron Lab Isolate" /LENGTH=117 /DNA_ID=CAMNT_0023446969 /DNA_START=84 /DNA_END=436 /DNA_ORIENTATION=-
MADPGQSLSLGTLIASAQSLSVDDLVALRAFCSARIAQKVAGTPSNAVNPYTHNAAMNKGANAHRGPKAPHAPGPSEHGFPFPLGHGVDQNGMENGKGRGKRKRFEGPDERGGKEAL